MSAARRAAAAGLLAALVCGLAPALARADGDPASDFLIVEQVFAPFDAKVPAAPTAQLRLLVKNAKAQGFPVKVALIGTRFDMGAIIVLWQHPVPYAHFLGLELSQLYRGWLVVVMPNGYGVFRSGTKFTRETAALSALVPPEKSGADLATAAIGAVRKLALLHGIRLAVPKALVPARTNNSSDRLLIALVVGGVLVALFVYVSVRRLRGSQR